jgi:hypothetical protein
LAVGVVASVVLGYFTGGLLHFPVSPARSAWVILVEFAMSLVEMCLINDKDKTDIKYKEPTYPRCY